MTPGRPAVVAGEIPEQIAAELRSQIIDGKLDDGEALGREPDLVAKFGVSRPTLREALRILETEGLIEVTRGVRGGIFVRAPNRRMTARSASMLLRARNVSLADVFEACYLLEPPAARAIASRSRGRRDAVDQLRSLLVREVDSLDDHEAFGLANHAFHEALITLAGNETLSLVAGTLNEILASAVIAVSSMDEDLTSLATRRRDLRSQQRLLELLDDGDADNAEIHWRAHMAYLARKMLRASETTLVGLLP